jgi:uncharacterized protein (DUF1810 family)
MTDSFDLQRFFEAQSPVYPRVLDELRRARKQRHRMWFIFPSLPDLGIVRWRGVSPFPRAKRLSPYLGHGVLGSRLKECTGLVNAVEGRTIREILGSPDDLKIHSSMTLFDVVSSDADFPAAIVKFYGVPRERVCPPWLLSSKGFSQHSA